MAVAPAEQVPTALAKTELRAGRAVEVDTGIANMEPAEQVWVEVVPVAPAEFNIHMEQEAVEVPAVPAGMVVE
jgi:hypothetical protein